MVAESHGGAGSCFLSGHFRRDYLLCQKTCSLCLVHVVVFWKLFDTGHGLPAGAAGSHPAKHVHAEGALHCPAFGCSRCSFLPLLEIPAPECGGWEASARPVETAGAHLQRNGGVAEDGDAQILFAVARQHRRTSGIVAVEGRSDDVN